MTTEGKAAAGGFAAIISSAAVCCTLPLLLGAGITLGAAGLALGSGLAVAAGAVLAVWGWRRYRTARSCEVGSSAGTKPEPADHTIPRKTEVVQWTRLNGCAGGGRRRVFPAIRGRGWHRSTGDPAADADGHSLER